MSHSFEANIGLDKFPIIIGNDIFQELIAYIQTYTKENVFIISDSYFMDSNLPSLFGCLHKDYLEPIGMDLSHNHVLESSGFKEVVIALQKAKKSMQAYVEYCLNM